MEKDYLQMRVLELAPQVFASGPLYETDLSLIARQDVRSIMLIRPDGEAPDQPKSADLAKAADEYGIVLVHFPVEGSKIGGDEAVAFMNACDDLKRPLLVCGRSGAQSTRVWETAEAS